MPTDIKTLLAKIKSPDATADDVIEILEAAYKLSLAGKLADEEYRAVVIEIGYTKLRLAQGQP
jgi:hypothetical protein